MGSQQTHDDGGTVHPSELTAFQRDLLAVLARGPDYGLGIGETVADYYGEEPNNGRLYPNLTELVESGLVEKTHPDKRTNKYALTDAGRDALRTQREWVAGVGAESDGFVLDQEHRDAPKDANGDPVFSDE